MKLLGMIPFVCFLLTACNNESKTSTTENNSTDTMSTMSQPATAGNDGAADNTATADAGTADFLMKAADGGLAEVAGGQLAQSKAMNESVKMFAGMMVQDHTGANQQVKDLAAKLKVSLPVEPSAAHQEKLSDAANKEGKAFDKAYMNMMVADHKKTIALFKEGSSNAGNPEVKDFIMATLPKLQQHLDSATAIQKRL